MDEQPVKSKKSHYILTFVIGISVIGVIIVILGIATNWFRGSRPNGPAGGSPGGYNCINTPTLAHPDGAYICTSETGGPYAAGCYESGPAFSVGTGCGGTHPETPVPNSCDNSTWSPSGKKPCTPCKVCPADKVVDNQCTTTADATCTKRLPNSCDNSTWSPSGKKPCTPCKVCTYGVKVACNSTTDNICKPKPPPGPLHYSCNFVSGLVSPNTCRVANKVPDSVDVLPQICQDWKGDDAQKKAQTACLYKDGKPTATGCSFKYDGRPGDNLQSCDDSPTECCWFQNNLGYNCTGSAKNLQDVVYFTGQYRDSPPGMICQGSPFKAQDKCLLKSQDGECITPGASPPVRPCGSGWVEDSKDTCCDSTAKPYPITKDLCNCSAGGSPAAAKLKVGDYGYNACTNVDDY